MLAHMNVGNKPAPLAKVVVVDDNPIIQRAVYFALRDKGYLVLMAGDVAAAMKIIRQEKPDLVLVDLSFPLDSTGVGSVQQDGFFLIDWILRVPDVVKPPMVIISSSDPAQYRDRATAAGILACLQKPLDKESLLKIIQSALGHGATEKPPAA
jgi:CheY-like chemotaxis protein